MNPDTCQQIIDGVGNGVAESLRAVDCMANTTAQAAFGRLFGHNGALLPALTILLTLYVAFFAFSLLTGRSRIGVSSLTPRMLTLGLVLTFATSWIAYQGVVWNLVVGGPDELASALMGTQGSSTQIFADKIDVVFGALASLSSEKAMGAPSTFSPPGLLWLGATLLLLGTVGVLATCKIALAILLALGPVFVVMALFRGTRGLFTGWLKGVVMLALAPLFAVLGGSLMLELAVPVLQTLIQTPDKIEPQPAMAFFMIGAVHMALMILVLKVAGTMVSSWTVFGLTEGGANRALSATQPMSSPATAVSTNPAVPRERMEPSNARSMRLPAPASAAANDPGTAPASAVRQTRVVNTLSPAGSAANPSAAPVTSRARGVGIRFRSASPRPKESFK